jgi:hypothetical protein
MKSRIILTGFILLICTGLFAQPPETTYQGNVAVSGYTVDQSFGPFNIGFDFTFYGNSYNQFYINSNGQVLFVSGSLESASADIPDPALPNNYIAAFWDELVVDSYGSVLYTTIGAAPNRKTIIQFMNMGFYPFPATLGTFSVILYETSNIVQVQYRLVVLSYSDRAHGGNATIGLENATGTAGTKYAFHNPSAINTEQSISFTPVSGSVYSINSNAVYDGVYLTTNLALPEPGIPVLISPPLDAVVGTSNIAFEWASAPNAASYTLYVGTDPDLAGATAYPAGSGLTQTVNGLTLDATYYWGVFAKNATGTTWCEIKRFTTSSTPPLAPVPQTIWTEQFTDKTIKLNYTGGNASSKTAVIASLPSQGQLYQYNAGVRGAAISSFPTTLTDAGRNVIYAASGGTGNSAGNFNFRIHDSGGDSPTGTITVNVSPPGVPNVLYFAHSNTLVEIQFDIPMADPAGLEYQFSVRVNPPSAPVTVTSANLKEGDPNTIQLNLAVPIALTDNVLLSYTPGSVTGTTGGLLLPFADEPVTLIAQTISFTQPLAKKLSDSPFILSATSGSGQGMTFSSSNLSVATVTANVATFHTLGNSDITARQAGNLTYAPAKYTRTLNVAKGDQTITFYALSPKTSGDPDYTISATATSGLGVTFVSSNTAVATVSGNTVHIAGAGTTVITASQPGNELWNPAADAMRTLAVSDPSSKTLSLTSLFLQGLYSGGGKMNQSYDETGMPHWSAGVADHITVELHSGTNYSIIVHSVSDVELSTSGTATVSVPSSLNGSYYITVKHRNSIETVSASPQSFAGNNIVQSFGSPGNVFGDNLVQMSDLNYAIYGGDINQDGIVDLSDSSVVDNQAAMAASGYIPEDTNGDGLVDLSDFVIIDNNSAMAIGAITP